jgi:hypothetical protein
MTTARVSLPSTSRPSINTHSMAIPNTTPKLTDLLTRSHPKRGLFHRLTSTNKHRIAFRYYTQCAMARALHGKKTRLQRQKAIAVRALKKSGRKDSKELERVWRWAGKEEAGEVEKEWETESDGSLE